MAEAPGALVGSGGPWEDVRTFAPSLTSLSGLERLIGYAGERALGALTLGYGDPTHQAVRDPRRNRACGPCLGEHNAEIFRGLLGLREEEYEALVRDGVIR